MLNFLVWFLPSFAFAQEGGAGGKPGMLEAFFPFVLIFVIFYFLIFRPQSKRMKEQQKILSELKRGDTVLTNGGILGTIEGLTEKFVTLEISEGVRVKVLRTQIAGPAKEAQP